MRSVVPDSAAAAALVAGSAAYRRTGGAAKLRLEVETSGRKITLRLTPGTDPRETLRWQHGRMTPADCARAYLPGGCTHIPGSAAESVRFELREWGETRQSFAAGLRLRLGRMVDEGCLTAAINGEEVRAADPLEDAVTVTTDGRWRIGVIEERRRPDADVPEPANVHACGLEYRDATIGAATEREVLPGGRGRVWRAVAVRRIRETYLEHGEGPLLPEEVETEVREAGLGEAASWLIRRRLHAAARGGNGIRLGGRSMARTKIAGQLPVREAEPWLAAWSPKGRGEAEEGGTGGDRRITPERIFLHSNEVRRRTVLVPDDFFPEFGQRLRAHAGAGSPEILLAAPEAELEGCGWYDEVATLSGFDPGRNPEQKALVRLTRREPDGRTLTTETVWPPAADTARTGRRGLRWPWQSGD